MLSFGIEQVVQVFVVTERLGWDADGVGLLNAFIGLGGLVAAPMAGRVAASRRAGRWLGWSGVTIGVTLVLLAATTSPAVAMGLALVEGAGNIVFDVLLITMLQRTCPEALLGRVFSLQDSAGSVSQLLGTVVAPVMIGVVSLEERCSEAAAWRCSPSPSYRRWRLYPLVPRQSERGWHRSSAGSERSASSTTPPVHSSSGWPACVRPVSVGTGAVVFHEGDPPDDLYVIDRGEVSVQSQASGEVGRLGPGDWFGEIGLSARGPSHRVDRRRRGHVTARRPGSGVRRCHHRTGLSARSDREGDVHPSRPDSPQAGYRPWPGVGDGSR